MVQVLYFNRSSLEQKLLDSEQHRQACAQYEELGWLRNPPLVHVVHPHNGDHLLVHADDAKRFLEKGYYRDPTWVYHPDEGAKMVGKEQAERMYQQGWYDTPAKFPANKAQAELAASKMRGYAPKEVA